MAERPSKLIKRCAQWLPQSEASHVPSRTRGVYALLQLQPHTKKYDVVYIGMAPSGGIRSRLRSHKKGETKIWSHFSIFPVWDNVGENQVEELEGLFQQIARKYTKAARFN